MKNNLFLFMLLIISIPQIGMCDNLSYTNLDISSEDVDNYNISGGNSTCKGF